MDKVNESYRQKEEKRPSFFSSNKKVPVRDVDTRTGTTKQKLEEIDNEVAYVERVKVVLVEC